MAQMTRSNGLRRTPHVVKGDVRLRALARQRGRRKTPGSWVHQRVMAEMLVYFDSIIDLDFFRYYDDEMLLSNIRLMS